PMTRPREGEILAVLDAGAYGYSMSSVYNLQPRPAEVIVPDTKLVTRRERFGDLMGNYTVK
ncbi:MAG: diaminopimelate decarboxylase, partial [Candidatus Bathyarchaeia archaeon]